MTRRHASFLALTVAATLVLAACGDDSDTTTADASTTSTGVTTSTTAATQAVVVNTTNDPKLGAILVDARGLTLYRFAKDTEGTSQCTGACAATWPPLISPAGAPAPTAGPGVTGTLATITRPDGLGDQVAYNGQPLYFFKNDAKPGDTNGQGVGGNWFAATVSSSAGGSNTTVAGRTSSTTGSGSRQTTTTARRDTTSTTAATTTTSGAQSGPTTTYCAYPPCY